MQKPQEGEYRPYFDRYISLIDEGDMTTILQENLKTGVDFFSSLPEHKHNYRYAEGKWTPKEVVMHLTDTERVMSYRALVAARGDSQTPLHSMDENLYAANVDVSNRTMDSLIQELAAVRAATIALYAHMTDAESQLMGNNMGHNITPRALGYIMAGHVVHHINITKERY